ncbi:IS1/IS1595 family N-terminal zinc-binding domain-containing protein [Leptothoe spongobia]|uniref:IS1 family transposase n=1 Tax=Leptothoe spongobia TAU-MAC 1115 TaxID=1967444 RepID=A0A947DCC2_9CYAN|nr:hypothetical protein [Leptothoe spongobia]MBT9314460.1 IS1 family transposase [Leptothoe spongobia TAU-MAC 1115]
MLAPLPNCPGCGSTCVVKNGKSHNGKQNHKCRNCGRQFVAEPTNTFVSDETKVLVDKLLSEAIPVASISRITGVSETWLYNYLKSKLRSHHPLIEDKQHDEAS